MLVIKNIDKLNKVFIGRKYRVDKVYDINGSKTYHLQLKHITKGIVMMVDLDKIPTQLGKYKLKIFNKSDYLTIHELKDIQCVKDRLKNLIK
jgi:hypothetical protein